MAVKKKAAAKKKVAKKKQQRLLLQLLKSHLPKAKSLTILLAKPN